MARARAEGRLVRTLTVVGFVLMLASWVGSNAPGFGPDEPANYIRSVGAGTGQWTGEPGRLAHPSFGSQPGAAERIDWINQNTRSYRLPAGLDPGAAGFPCDLFRNWLSAHCLDRPHRHPSATRALSYVGTYEPYVYAVTGAAMARTHSALAALYTGRAVNATLVAALLAVAVAAAYDRRAGPVSLVGVVLAASPMVLFMGSVLGTNGIEIAATLALFTLVLRLGRSGGAPGWAWPAAGLVGALLALSRPTGPAWVLLALVIGLAVADRSRASESASASTSASASADGLAAQPRRPRRWRHRQRGPVGWRVLWLAPAAVGVAATLAWERKVQPHPQTRWDLVVEGLHRLPVDAESWLHQWVGVFGWASLPMPPATYWAWWLAVVALALVAFGIGTPRARVALAAVLVLAVAVAIAADVLVLRQTRFPVFGRYLLPLAVLVPLAAGEIVTRRVARLPRALHLALQVLAPLLAATVHLVGLWADARRYAVGTNGPVWFLPAAAWAPPGGWPLWLTLAAAGAACLAAAALPGLRIPLVDTAAAQVSGPVRSGGSAVR